MTLIGLDLNASRARAIQGENHGSGPHIPMALPLDGNERELPLALSLEERQPRVGRAGAGLCRKSPHLACLDFLPYLGDSRIWSAGRHRLDAAGALALLSRASATPARQGRGRDSGLAGVFQPRSGGAAGESGRQGALASARLGAVAGRRRPGRARAFAVVGPGRRPRSRWPRPDVVGRRRAR